MKFISMKCKSWSKTINNFVVRRLNLVKISYNKTHILNLKKKEKLQKIYPKRKEPTSQLQNHQHQFETYYITMPAMSKESNSTELKLKELSTTAEKKAAASNKSSSEISADHSCNSKNMASASAESQTQQQAPENSSSAANNCFNDFKNMKICNSSQNLLSGSPRYLSNGYGSPLMSSLSSSSSSSNTSLPTSQVKTQDSQNNSQSPSSESVQPAKKTPNDFIFGKFIGEGSFSNVYLGVEISTKREYAIKVCEKRHILRENKQEYVKREREVMHILSNVPGFVNLACTFQDYRNLFFVMTYAKNGDLLPFINKVGSFDVDGTRHYASEVLLACEQMHRRNIVHRDLKPENILLDENMHTLIADFGSAKILTDEEKAKAELALARAANESAAGVSTGLDPCTKTSSSRLESARPSMKTENSDDEDDDDAEPNSDDMDSPSHRPEYRRKRCGSFVGTAQYVSPEVLQNGPITPMVDLWALGCIIYQMISGLPPFRGSNEFFIFREIIALNLEFPEGFDSDAEDLVRNLLKLNPAERLGAFDKDGCYTSIRKHNFFAGIDFENIRKQTPPPICPNLPGVKSEEEFISKHRHVPDNLFELEPGLNDKQINRLLGMELGCVIGNDAADKSETKDSANIALSQRISGNEKTRTKNPFKLNDEEKVRLLMEQKSDKWHVFADNEVILKKGFVNKRKGLFARKRMLLLTTGPRLIYIDPVQMIKKGEIPWSPELRVEAKNFKIFFVHTPNRTYYLDDPEGFALEWVDSIERMRVVSYPKAINNEFKSTTSGSTAAPSSSELKSVSSNSSVTSSAAVSSHSSEKSKASLKSFPAKLDEVSHSNKSSKTEALSVKHSSN